MTDEEALKEIGRQEKRRVESEKLRICVAGRCPAVGCLKDSK